MKLTSISLIIFLIMSLNSHSQGLSHSQNPQERDTSSTSELFHQISQCSQRIWPKFNFSDIRIVHFDDSKEIAHIFIGADSSFSTVNYNAIPELLIYKAPYYDFFELKNQKWMSLNLQKTTSAKDALNLGVHEYFHELVQDPKLGWVWTSRPRGLSIPVQYKARLYRAKIDSHLRIAFLNPALKNQSLKLARYWYDLWVNEFPSEALSTTDGYEGSAEYAEEIASALITTGCSATETQLRDTILAAISKGPSLEQLYGERPLDSEGYIIGSLAAHILRFDHPVPKWTDRVARGETPLSILMEQVSPDSATRETANNELINAFEKVALKKQSQIDQLLGPTIELLSSKDFISINIPNSWKPGATSYFGFYIHEVLDLKLSVLGSENTFTDSKFGWVKSSQNAISLSKSQSDCKQYGWTVIIPKSSLSLQADGIYAFKSESWTGAAKGTIKSSSWAQGTTQSSLSSVNANQLHTLCLGE